MELPDFMKYKDTFSQSSFVEKISRIAKRAGSKLVYAALLLYYTLMDPNVPVKDKALILGALGYLVSPLDVIADAIPIAGLSDDLAVLIYVLHKVWDDITDETRQKAHDKLSKWFDDDEMVSADDLFKENPSDDPV